MYRRAGISDGSVDLSFVVTWAPTYQQPIPISIVVRIIRRACIPDESVDLVISNCVVNLSSSFQRTTVCFHTVLMQFAGRASRTSPWTW